MNNTESYIIFGGSQSGKSSFVNFHAGKNLAAVGDGSGVSVTTKFTKYTILSKPLNKSISIYDTPGFCDNRLALTDKKIIEYIKSAMIECLDSGSRFKGFLVIESVMDDIFSLPGNLSKLYTVAAPGSKNSVIVIVNKFDMVSINENKLRNIETYCNSNNLKYVK